MLKIAKEVFHRLGESGIRYCHWKSNQHLDRSFSGTTDFDLLVARADWIKFELLMLGCGLKRRTSTADRVYPSMEDFLGFDIETGAMIHLHVHFELILGRKSSKNFRLPIEKEVLKERVVHENFPIYVIGPEYELAILVIRALLKLRFAKRSSISLLLGRSALPSNIDREFAYLLEHIDEKKLEHVLGTCFSAQTQVIRRFLSGYRAGISWPTAYALRRSMISAMKSFERLTPIQDRQSIRLRRLAERQCVRGFAPGGFTIALVGADGAGKSTTVTAIDDWLSWKLTIRTYYMGIPKSTLTRLLNFNIRVFSKLRLSSPARGLSELRWLYCARKRYRNYQRATEYRNQGGIVIFDRYPLPELWKMQQPMDGPRIDSKSRWAAVEKKYYELIDPPDYLFVLQVPYEDSLRRKTAQKLPRDREIQREKIDAVYRLNGDQERVFTFDTTLGFNQNLLNIKRRIWESLS
ncbi:MAG: hypothetical protein E4H01_10550 [Lysobacterales bacterium]|nr:MAG: hypothetical protein E4H01_10550 [Xanthomonadales bacterium]